MYTINKITSDHVIDFAAEELKKYLRMMMPECGEISIMYNPSAESGIRLGVMADFGIDASEADDITIDDVLHIHTDYESGIISGSNPRSVLLAVYKYLWLNGCRWLFPGIDGELIPVKDIVPIKYHKMADCRYRGQCNEGAEFQQNMIDIIDYLPKVGMNVFMIEFDNPKAYYDNYYNHVHNTANREPEPVSEDTVKQWKRQCEAEISKRGLQFHDMGHGWTAEPFGISSTNGWQREFDNPIPPQSREMVAMINGKRELCDGIALNTQFCMSNEKARSIVVKYIVEYARMHQNVDYLHVWLADGPHNHCECDECRKRIPSDWYVILLNEIDEHLSAEKLDTRIVFICYTDTTWAPVTEKLNNIKRFSFMLAAITRTYNKPVPVILPEVELRPYVRNEVGSFPETVEEYIHHANNWKKAGDCPSLVYEYHFWIHQYRDPGTMEFSKLIYDDIIGYYKNGFNGLIEDGSQRSFFPNGFCFYVYAQTLFDVSSQYEDMKRDYFSHAYGNIWTDVEAYLTEISKAFDMKYLMGKLNGIGTTSAQLGCYYDTKRAKELSEVKSIAEKYSKVFEFNKNMPYRAQTVAMRLLRLHVEYCKRLADIWVLKATGKDAEAIDLYKNFEIDFGRYELEIEQYFDQRMCFNSFDRLICSPKTFYEAD